MNAALGEDSWQKDKVHANARVAWLPTHDEWCASTAGRTALGAAKKDFRRVRERTVSGTERCEPHRKTCVTRSVYAIKRYRPRRAGACAGSVRLDRYRAKASRIAA